MLKARESVQSYWDARSQLFANYYKRPSLFDQVFRRGVYQRQAVAVAACRALGTPTVLDIGSGPGEVSVSLIKNGHAKHVTGVDFAQHMMEQASATAAQAGVAAQCTFMLGDVLTHDFEGATFDYACALGVFDYVENAAALLGRMAQLTTRSFMASWPENGVRMALRRQRYTCPLFHYALPQIRQLHRDVGISDANLEVVRLGGGWATVAHKRG